MDERTPLPLVVLQAILASYRELDRLRAKKAEIEARRARAHTVASTNSAVRKETEQDLDNSPQFKCDNCGQLFPQNKVKPWARNKAQPLYCLCPECVLLGCKAEKILICEIKVGLPVNLKQTSGYSPRLGTLRVDQFIRAPSEVAVMNALRKAENPDKKTPAKKTPAKKLKGMRSVEIDW